MLTPRDFTHWTYWLRYEWREWNPYRLSRKISWFLGNVWAYRKILWHDRDWDWVFLVSLMQIKFRRMGRHLAAYGITVDKDRMARECRVAAALCQRLIDDEYLQHPITRASMLKADARRKADLDYLTHLIRRKLFCWWN